ncbi:MAG: hypothetical protein ACTSYD_09280 [Candidatus Heimdallarchaeaceae archaeon]
MVRLSILNRPLKVTHSFEHTFQNNHIKITVAKKSLLFPIFDDTSDAQIGFYYNGPIGITADLLVHSNKGAVGKTIEKTYSNMLLFPGLLPFLDERVKEVKPIEGIEEHLTNIINNIRITGIKIWNRNPASQETFMFIHKHPFALWGINNNTTLYIKPPLICGRRGDNSLFWIEPSRFEFVSKDGNRTIASELSNPHLLLRKVITLLKNTAFANLFQSFIQISD